MAGGGGRGGSCFEVSGMVIVKGVAVVGVSELIEGGGGRGGSCFESCGMVMVRDVEVVEGDSCFMVCETVRIEGDGGAEGVGGT